MQKSGTFKGYTWFIRDNTMGCLCGYVYVPLGHPQSNIDFESLIQVHGGITYVGDDIDGCPKLLNGKWIGFDCAHAGDLPDPRDPNSLRYFGNPMATFKDEHYVLNEIKRVILQLDGTEPFNTNPPNIAPTSEKEQDFRLDLPF